MLHCLTNVTVPQQSKTSTIITTSVTAVETVYFGGLVTGAKYNTIQPGWTMLLVQCTDFQRNREHVQCTNKNNFEDTLLLAARFKMAVPTACFKFTPAAPNITGYATRERHIFAMASTVQVGIYV